jgi:hypothetical protein
METSRRVSTQTIHVQEDNFSKSNNNLQNQRSPQKELGAKKTPRKFHRFLFSIQRKKII